MSLGQASFGTDRGARKLPAWRFALAGVWEPAWVLAVDPQQLWQPAPMAAAGPGSPAILSADGRSLSYTFFGSPASCGVDYAGRAAESSTAVVVMVREIAPTPAEGSSEGGCPAVAVPRTVTVQLATPLGARVLLTADGATVIVVSS